MTDPLYCGNGQSLPQNLAGLIDMYAVNTDLQNWRETYGTHHGGAEYHEGLRRLLRAIRKSVWIELVSGYSRAVYGGLDVYVRLVSDAVLPEEDARFLVWDVERVNPMDRWLPAPFDWYTFQHWFSMGQKPQISQTKSKISVCILHEAIQPHNVVCKRFLPTSLIKGVTVWLKQWARALGIE